MSITIKDIAQAAGVSYSTVSKALNNSPLVQPSTKQKIISIAHELGYQPNFAAKSLVSKQTKTIGVSWPSIERIALSTIVTQINAQIEAAGYSMILSINDVPQAVKMFQRFHVDGIVVFDEYQEWNEPIQMDIPIVYYGRTSTEDRVNTIDLNHRQAILLAVQYLKKLNHKQIAYIGDLSHQDRRQVEKYNGFTEGMIKYGIESHPDMLVNASGLQQQDGYIAVRHLLEAGYKPTAMITASYDLTLGALRAISERGLQVPGHISLVGYDNVPQMNDLNVPITCVGAPAHQISHELVDMLMHLVQSNDKRNQQHDSLSKSAHFITPELVERSSCMPIPD